MSEAIGVHVHETYKLGRQPPSNKPALMLKDVLTGTPPTHPATADHFRSFSFGLYQNDQYGDCGPTSVANLVRLVTGGLLGSEIQPTQADVFDLYKRSGNPNFPADDNGVDMQTMLEALLAGGIGGHKPVAFAKVDVSNEEELRAAISIFGGILLGVDLQVAQQSQTNSVPPRWSFSPSPEWGGHAILAGAYEDGSIDDVITWAQRVQTTADFRQNQLGEAWVVVWPWNLDHPAFQQGVDELALASAYKAITGRELPVPEPFPPTPAPPAAQDPDHELWTIVKDWSRKHHLAETKHVAEALKKWAAEKNIM